MKQISDIVQMVSAILSPMAIVIAGLWAFWRFIIQKEREPRAEFDLTAEFIGLQNGKWVVEVSAHLANRGKVRHMMKDATLNIRYLKASDPIVESQDEGHFGQVEFPHSIGRRKIWQDSFIDPGLAFRNSYLTWVPADATYILLLCKFEYERGKWPAQRVLKVPIP